MTNEFLLTSLVVVLLPGTGVIYTLAVGLGRGFWPAVIAALGCTLGIVPHLIASIVGLAALLHASAVAFQIIKYLGVAYLFYMAWSVIRDGGSLDVEPSKGMASATRLVRDGIALNVLNPKLSIFFLAFLPQFVAPDSPAPTVKLIGLALVFMAMTFAVFVIYGAAASAARDYVISRPVVMAWLKRSFAAAFGLLGLRLAMAER
ncbi:MAG: LysE family translocator [Pseudomonadota bacterium]